MNLQVKELKIGKVSPAEINWNYEEMKASLTAALVDYKNLVVTEDTLKAAKDVLSYLPGDVVTKQALYKAIHQAEEVSNESN